MNLFQNIVKNGDTMVAAGLSVVCAVIFFANLNNGTKKILVGLALAAVAFGIYTQRVPIANGIGNLISGLFN